MKNLSKFLFAALALTAAVTSCNDPKEGGDVILTADRETIVGNGTDKVIFTVTQDGQNVTGNAIITCGNNGDILDATNRFTSETGGTFTFTARVNGKTSNVVTITVSSNARLVLSADKSVLAVGETATFTVTQEGRDVTGEVNICATGEGGVCLGSPTFSSNEAGVFTFHAYYLDNEENDSNEVSLSFTDAANPVKFRKAVAFFNITGTWCPPCGSFKTMLKNIQNENGDKVIIVCFYSETAANPVYNNVGNALWLQAHSSGNFSSSIIANVPTTLFDLRTMVEGASESKARSAYTAEAGKEARTGIQVESSISDNKVSVNVEVMAESAGKYGIGALLIEDNVQYKQANQPDNYNHTGVLRGKGVTNIFGDDLGTMQAGDTQTKTFSFDAVSREINKVPILVHENLYVVVYTTYEENGKQYIANIVKAPASGFTGYKFDTK